MSNSWVGPAVGLGFRGEILVDVVHSGDHSRQVGRSSREKLSPILEDLRDERDVVGNA